MYAAKQGMVDDVKALLQQGANRQRKDNSGKTARAYASPWPWQQVPGFLTQERAKELETEAKWDQHRIAELLEGKPDPGTQRRPDERRPGRDSIRLSASDKG